MRNAFRRVIRLLNQPLRAFLSRFVKPQVYIQPVNHEPPVVYMDPEFTKRRADESYSQYCERVPLAFHPTEPEIKLSYRGKPLV